VRLFTVRTVRSRITVELDPEEIGAIRGELIALRSSLVTDGPLEEFMLRLGEVSPSEDEEITYEH
jgi:hypothetical protein